MYKGDIANDIPRRVLVTYEAVTLEYQIDKKFLGVKTGEVTRRRFDRVTLNRLWRYTSKSGVGIELVNLGADDEDLAVRQQELDQLGTNPINYLSHYRDMGDFLEELPYRPEVLGVLDTPDRQGMYGSRGIGMEHLERAV